MKSSQSNSVYGGNSRELKNSAKSSFTSTTLFILAVLKRGVEFCKFVMAEDSCVKPTKADEGAFVPVKSAWGERSCEVSDQFKRIWIAHLDQLTTIDFPGAGQTYGSGINDRGEVVGFTNEGHCYLWRDGEFTTIDFPGARNTTPWGINKHGQIVGTYYEQPSGLSHGFLLEDGDYSSIDFPDGSNTAALGINNNGDIVG